MKKIIKFSPLFLLVLVLPVVSLSAKDHKAPPTALRGYDVVSYHLGDGIPQKGDKKNAAQYDGMTYLFANAKNKKAFDANPEKYLPAYDGYCAYGVLEGSKVPSDPLAYTVVDGKLYLNYSKNVRNLWRRNIPGNIAKADKMWLKLKK